MPDQAFDIIIIGGGIVGLSTAMHATRSMPGLRLLVVEKENEVARHQSGHNSGVIHAGIYYKPGSLKAKFCVEGAAAMVEFCREHSLPHQVCGKVIVATSDDEVPRLKALLERGQATVSPDCDCCSRKNCARLNRTAAASWPCGCRAPASPIMPLSAANTPRSWPRKAAR